MYLKIAKNPAEQAKQQTQESLQIPKKQCHSPLSTKEKNMDQEANPESKMSLGWLLDCVLALLQFYRIRHRNANHKCKNIINYIIIIINKKLRIGVLFVYDKRITFIFPLAMAWPAGPVAWFCIAMQFSQHKLSVDYFVVRPAAIAFLSFLLQSSGYEPRERTTLLGLSFLFKQFLAFSASKDMAQEYMAKPATQQLGGGIRQVQVNCSILLCISTQKI
ncbi:hypothetical protein NC653_030554 [Populus alba x Populus x berolinensis]|uniref:Uncharacterized protein n=1 Tax=Populus alba x Populus x berolinensis TaxID=444605 RepID=A0AAD6LXG2_9ROSI|nr:hypothetical protein NC653_030554 [Populus alba x Populus x berolinensis]